MRVLALFWVLLLAAPLRAQDSGVVSTGAQAYIVLPADVVASGGVAEARWSSDGRSVLVRRVTTPITPQMVKALTSGVPAPPPISEVQLLLWDTTTRKLQRVWSARSDPGAVVSFGWMTGAPVALASVSLTSPPPGQVHRSLLRITSDGKTSSVAADQTEGLDALDFSPFAPMVIWRRTDVVGSGTGRPSSVWSLIDSSGRVRPLPPVLQQPEPTMVMWSPTGDLQVVRTRAASEPGARPVREWYRIDTRTMAATPIAAQAPSGEVRRRSALTVLSGACEARSGSATAHVKLLWLDGGSAEAATRTLLCADGDWGLVSPTADGVVWCSRGALWYAPLARLSAERLAQMREQAQRLAAMSAGKQVALTVLMYAQDHDEVLPGPDGIVERLQAYAARASIFDGLVYTFAGSKLSEVASPATTELGYIPSGGGRAVLFVDGHVEWRQGR